MTARDIINSAIVAGATQFEAALRDQSAQHETYFRSMTASVRGRQGAKASRDACRAAADNVRFGAVNDICDDLAQCVIALNVACKMQGIGPATRTAAIVDWDESQRARGVWS